MLEGTGKILARLVLASFRKGPVLADFRGVFAGPSPRSVADLEGAISKDRADVDVRFALAAAALGADDDDTTLELLAGLDGRLPDFRNGPWRRCSCDGAGHAG